MTLLSIPSVSGEAIPDTEDRLCFSISSQAKRVSKSPVIPNPVVSPSPVASAPAPAGPLKLSLVEQKKLGLVPISGIQVDSVTPDLLQKVINYYIKSREWYDGFSKTLGGSYQFAHDGYIYLGTEKRGLHFYDAQKQGKELANTYAVPVTATVGSIRPTQFACSETPFQAAKINLLVGSTEAQNFVSQFHNKTGGAIQRDVAPRIQRIATTTGKTVNAQFYQPWDDSSVWVMINLVLGKALQNQNHPMIKFLIHQLPRVLIVEHTGNDDKWGDGSKLNPSILGPGENRLGLIWMAVQTTLKDHYKIP